MAKAQRKRMSVASAASLGRKAGAEVFKRRAAQHRKRRSVRPERRRALAAKPAIPLRTRQALAAIPPPTGLLVAEGDSWFDYPFNDVLSMLEEEHGFEIESVAHKGDTVEDMAYSGGQFEDFTKLLEKVLKQGRVPDAILISGGGNDIAGDEFPVLLNHAASGLAPLNADIVRGVVDVRLRNAYTFLIAGLSQVAREFLNRPIPIVLHGYDYAVPDGRGVLGGWAFLPGPWLRPGFHQKGHGDFETNRGTVVQLIDAFNKMLSEVSQSPGFGHVRYVNLRKTLTGGSNYKADWANELHPTKRGFKAVAARIAASI